MSTPFIGELKLFAPAVVPRGWLPCDGQALAISSHEALFSILGTLYGGDGIDNFRLPDLRGRVPLGAAPAYPLGQPGGAATHTLTGPEMPAHTHQVTAAFMAASTAGIEGNFWAATTSWSDSADTALAPAAIKPAGAGQDHPNLQPYLALNYYIATAGIIPVRPSGEHHG